MDSRDASIHSRQRSPPPPPQGILMAPFAFGPHFPNNNLGLMGAANSGSNLLAMSNPSFSFNPLTAPQPFGETAVVGHHQQQQQQNGSPATGVSAAAVAAFGAEQGKKKRGRPRKYSPDGIGLGLSSNSQVVAGGSGGGDGQNEVEGSQEKRQRGRPPGSGKKQLDALGGPGGAGFTPHVIKISAGENIVSKMVEFAQEGSRTICILSANGAVHNVTLQRVAAGTIYHEGQLEIISLSGSICSLNSDGSQNTTVNLTVTLAGPDGKVVGGGVTRELIAAAAVQIVAGSFIVDRKKSNASILTATPEPNMLSFGRSAPPNNSTQPDAASGSSDDNPGLYKYSLGQPWTGATPGWA